MVIPRIMIAGTNSGCGKTTISIGIMAALIKRGLKLQPFKVGPDYIDPMFHTFITGRSSRNLDSWILNEDTLAHLFLKNTGDEDIAVIEGVMGLFDGYGGRSIEGSTAHVSKIIGAPIILVIDCKGMSFSVAALVQGFRDFDADVNIHGIIINNIHNTAHYKLLKDIIEERTGITVIGFLQSMPEITLPDRHLGLVTSGEIDGLRERLDCLSEQVEKTIDLDLLLKIARDVKELKNDAALFATLPNRLDKSMKIAVAWDKAFNFYYRDNLDLLEKMGAELVYFSPMEDKCLPQGICGIYLGGGYPEVWAEELENNISMRNSVKNAIVKGMPAYAECGGLMYLSQSIMVKEGKEYEMVGIINARSSMTSALQRFGYVEVEITEDNILSGMGNRIRAHEFHFSETEVDSSVRTCYRVTKGAGDVKNEWRCGFKMHNMLAGYPHIHFWANPEFAQVFIDNCCKYTS